MQTPHDDVTAPTTRQAKKKGALPIFQVCPPHNRAQHAIWDARQALHLRKSIGLLGDFVGTLPKHLSQNQFLSLPLMLNHEEVTHGVAQGVFQPVMDNPSDYAAPTPAAVDLFREERDVDIQRQVEEVVVKQREERIRRGGGDVNPRKRKRFENASLVNGGQDDCDEDYSDGAEETSPADDDDTSEQVEPPAKMGKLGFFSRISSNLFSMLYSFRSFSSPGRAATVPDSVSMVQSKGAIAKGNGINGDVVINGNSQQPIVNDEEWREAARQKVLDEKARHQARTSSLVVTATAARDDEIEQRRLAPSIPAPPGVSRRCLRARRVVFDDLRRRGYYISCGAKFGADFLAYAGDPQLFHAALAVVVVNGHNDIAAKDVVALGRLGDSTRKRTVLAWSSDDCLHDSEKPEVGLKVHYVGVQWEETLP